MSLKDTYQDSNDIAVYDAIRDLMLSQQLWGSELKQQVSAITIDVLVDFNDQEGVQ